MNIHVPDEIKAKYPHMEFRGKQRQLNDRTVIEAYNKIGNIEIPIIVRLQGTNAIEAKKLIDESGLKVFSAIALQDAADLVKQVLSK